MKKIKLFALTTVAGLATVAPLTTITSCGNDKDEGEDEKVVTLKSVNLSIDSLSVYKAGKLSVSNSRKNESEDVTPTLWETKLTDGNLVMTEVTGTDAEGETVTIAPDWTKQIDNDHLILSFSNNLHDEGNVQYCVNLKDGTCTKLRDFWVVETIDDHDFAFQRRTIGGKTYIYFVATYVNLSGRQNSQGGGLIRVEADYFDTFDKSKITRVSAEDQWVATMVWDKGRPVAHHFSVNTEGDVLFYCSLADLPSQSNFDNKWGLLYNKLNDKGIYNPDDAYKLFHQTSSNGEIHCSVSAIYNQGTQFFFKDEGSGLIYNPLFQSLDEATHKCYVSLDKELYLNANETYGILEPYSRHIVRTKYGFIEKIVNIDNGHIIDLYTGAGKIQKEAESTIGKHHWKFDMSYDYVDYTSNIAYFVNKGKIIGGDYSAPTLYAIQLNKNDDDYYEYFTDRFAPISGSSFDVNNLQFTSFNVIDNNNVLIGAYDNAKAAYVTIQGKYNNGWAFDVSNEQYTSPIDQFELIQSESK